MWLMVTSCSAAQIAVQAWVQRYNGPGHGDDEATGMAVDSSGNVIVTGYVDVGSSSDYATIKYSGAGVPLWTNRYNGPGNGDDRATAVAVDGTGNVAVTGASFSGSSDDFATIKYSSAGVPLWTNRYNGPGNSFDQANAVAVDGSGNVVVTGQSTGSGSFEDYATIKYSGAGLPLWTNRYNGPGNGIDYPYAVAVDGSGNVVVTGASAGNGSSDDYATINYSSAGVPLWTNRYNGPGNSGDTAAAVAVDGSGNVLVTGDSVGGSGDYATIKYSGAGLPLWTNRYNAGPSDVATAVAVDGGGNVFVAGLSYDSGSSADYATVKYSAAGVPLWTNRYNGPGGPGNGIDEAQAVAVDGSGNVLVTGGSFNGSSSYDYATIKYSGAGVPLWTNRYNGPGNDDDEVNAVAVDGIGNVFVTGFSVGIDGSWDYATIKYSSTSAPLLTVARTTTNTVAISWPSLWTGFMLQQNTNSIATAGWSNILTSPTDNGTTKTVTVNPAAGKRFFRLKSQ
jgi:uncharacterized delta-60 repeat protein